MNRLILIDGNNLLFRSYYATAYTGNFMKNSKDFPTNALFGFTNMINKIILEEKPTYILVAFDKGKTFRNEMYDDYKAGRIEMPEELKVQFPIAKDLLTAMGIKYYEIEGYEADDIIGTFASYCDDAKDFQGTIISSDKDLLQLISNDVDIKLLKQKDYIRYDLDSFYKDYGIKPEKIVDLKSLQGDSSDNIPGVKGIGEKTALKLLKDYGSLDGIYESIEDIKGKLREKLENDKDNAYLSYKLAKITKDAPLKIDMCDVLYKNKDHKRLTELYEDLEFYSFLKKENNKSDEKVKYAVIDDISLIKTDKPLSIHIETDNINYHKANVLGVALYNEDVSYFVKRENLENIENLFNGVEKYTYDLKKLEVCLKYMNSTVNNVCFDTMIAAYLLNYNVKEDVAYLANQLGYDVFFAENIYSKKEEFNESKMIENAVKKAKFIHETKEEFISKLKEEDEYDLFIDMEMPLASTLAEMEYNGVYVNEKELKNMGEEIDVKLDIVSNDIYNKAGEEFNIGSPKQLAHILFDKLGLPTYKKGKTGFSTSVDVLNKLKDKHPIIKEILKHRNLSKLKSTYIDGLINTISEDGKIHTMYNQTLARTGRLSSIEPNLQNIPIRSDYGRKIRKAFVPSKDSILLSSDYSQIELRILAHIANVDSLIEAFNEGVDIHTKTASDIFDVDKEIVNSEQRRIAKAVNFGIIYGISSYGLSENLDISDKEASEFIDKYLKTYPGIKEYMDGCIKKAYEDGYVVTLFNRKRKVEELSNTNYMIRKQGERIALNTPIQGTSADIIKIAMVNIKKEFEKQNIKSKMILQVHDELVFDTLKEEEEKVSKIVRNIMESVVEYKVPLKVDISTGCNWYEVK